MNKLFYKIVPYTLLILSLCLSSCSRFSDDEFDSTNPSLSESSLTLDFIAEANTTTYQTLVFTNRSNENYELFNIAKADDDCSAFSLLNITNTQDEILFESSSTTDPITADQNYAISILVAPRESIHINIQFSPPPCEVTEYQPTLLIYFNTSAGTQTESVLLNAVVSDNSQSNNCGEMHQIGSLDELIGEEPSRLLPELEPGQYYAMVPYKIFGYLQPTEGFSSMTADVYAYFDNPNVVEPGYFAPYIPVLYENEGELSVPVIGNCRGFQFPTSITDQFFIGARQTLTTNQDFPFLVETQDTENLGAILLPGFEPIISATVTSGNSIVVDENGQFTVKFHFDLTTGRTGTNEYLQNAIGKIFNQDGEDALNIVDNGAESYMEGSNLRHGEFTLVGIGEVMPEDYILSDEAVSGLVNTPTYFFLQMHFKVVILSEDQIPIEENVIGGSE